MITRETEESTTYIRGGSAEPTRDKNIIGMYRWTPPSYVTPVGRLASRGGCGPVGQTTETVMGRIIKKSDRHQRTAQRLHHSTRATIETASTAYCITRDGNAAGEL